MECEVSEGRRGKEKMRLRAREEEMEERIYVVDDISREIEGGVWCERDRDREREVGRERKGAVTQIIPR